MAADEYFMPGDDSSMRQEAQEVFRRMVRAARRWRDGALPVWIWQQTLEEVGNCRMCGRVKLMAVWSQIEVCHGCDIDPAHPPTLRDVQ